MQEHQAMQEMSCCLFCKSAISMSSSPGDCDSSKSWTEAQQPSFDGPCEDLFYGSQKTYDQCFVCSWQQCGIPAAALALSGYSFCPEACGSKQRLLIL